MANANRVLRCAVVAILFAFAVMAMPGRVAAQEDPDHAPGVLGMAVGLNALRDLDDAGLDAEFAEYAALGMEWVRTDLYWADVQAGGPGNADWSEFDRIVDYAARHDLNVLPVVGTTPDWARADRDAASSPGNPNFYARFVERAVRRYAPRDIHVWEIWNEPNLASNWPPRPDPAAYAAVLAAAYDAIHAADPEATVLLGGLSPAAWTGPPVIMRHYAAPAFLAAIYAAGAGDSFDAVAFHPYSYPEGPSGSDPANGWAMMTGEIRDIMRENGDSDKKIWITEYGAPTNDGHGGISEAAQAEMFAESLRLARQLDWAGPLFWYSYRDLGEDPQSNENWFGVIDHDGRRKPAWHEMRGFTR
ncbi:Cellulase (glycosyl hydrolase family 5) [Paracoccus isoporae]|uniref:Cellulase (Glycosyl hydrolase family 5) n=1 Tax=Paracoccus isoporae TaxID=591205 RepID=A0A1G7BA80_9RHOB|nr:cellulase family glycosylhydrolase [Paracoccus isoporae]SDE23913.1 Cellulase (glycosyl hydrolase family 5) [Paracoccus isoporae]